MSSLVRRMFAFVVLAATVGLSERAKADVAVCGPILVNTTWTIANNTYVVTCDVVVMPGATLTIQPGVTVLFDPGTKLRVQGGQVVATGTNANPIIFASSDQTNRGLGLEIVPSGITGGLFDFCHFQYLINGIALGCCGGVTPIIANDCQFIANNFGITGYTGVHALINRCLFNSNATATDTADKTFEDCGFINNGTNMTGVERITLRRCNILGGTAGVVGSGNAYNVFIYDTSIVACTTGVYTPTVMERCTVSFNTVGVRFFTPPQSLQCNDIHSNTMWNVENLSPTTVTFANNWWGTTNTATIDAGIRDGNDQAGLGYVLYLPILTGTYPSGPCNCVLPVATPTLPPNPVKFSGTSVAFSTSATGTPPLTYRWYYNGVPIFDNGHYSGCTTATMTISSLYRNGGFGPWTDGGVYSCRVSNLCGFSDSAQSFLTVNNCIADVNNSGTISTQDLFDFLAAFFGGCP